MIDKDLIKEKIRNIQEYLGEIEHLFPLDTAEILSNVEKLRTMERIFQLVVDEILDINIHFIKELNLTSPDDFQGTFAILGENDILPADFARKFSPVVGLRNIIVHRYEELDRKFFIDTFKKNRADFDKYLNFINEYLKKID